MLFFVLLYLPEIKQYHKLYYYYKLDDNNLLNYKTIKLKTILSRL